MTDIPVMAEITLTIAYFCLPLLQIFEAHRGSNIRKGGEQKYHQDQKISGNFFAMAKKMPMLPIRTENGGNVVSAERFPLDIFRTINPCHGSIVRKRLGAASRPIATETTINRSAHGG
jgi:hypothetical protein